MVICYLMAACVIGRASKCAGRTAEAAGMFPLGILLDA